MINATMRLEEGWFDHSCQGIIVSPFPEKPVYRNRLCFFQHLTEMFITGKSSCQL